MEINEIGNNIAVPSGLFLKIEIIEAIKPHIPKNNPIIQPTHALNPNPRKKGKTRIKINRYCNHFGNNEELVFFSLVFGIN
jgi:hypothetical protein